MGKVTLTEFQAGIISVYIRNAIRNLKTFYINFQGDPNGDVKVRDIIKEAFLGKLVVNIIYVKPSTQLYLRDAIEVIKYELSCVLNPRGCVQVFDVFGKLCLVNGPREKKNILITQDNFQELCPQIKAMLINATINALCRVGYKGSDLDFLNEISVESPAILTNSAEPFAGDIVSRSASPLLLNTRSKYRPSSQAKKCDADGEVSNSGLSTTVSTYKY